MRQIFALGLCFSLYLIALASNYSISGKIVGEDGTPLPRASVLLEGTKRATLSDFDGNFEFQQLASGSYRLKTSYVGYEPSIIGIDLSRNDVKNITIKLRKNYLMLDQIVVTATRTERTSQEIAVPTIVLTEKEIRENGAKDVAEAISDRLGVDLRGGRTGGQSAEILGADPKYALVLVDGEPLVGKFDDRSELGSLSLDRVERIEIVKGPGSSLYGSEAMSGVINIITKRPQKPLELSTEVKGGEYELGEISQTISSHHDDWSILLNGSSMHQGRTPMRDYLTMIGKDRADFGGKILFHPENSLWSGEIDGGFTNNREISKDASIRYETRVLRYDYRPSVSFRYRPWAEVKFKSRFSQYDRLYDVFVRKSGYHDMSQSNDSRERLLSAELDYNRQFSADYTASFGLSLAQSDFDAARVAWGAVKKNIVWSVFAQSEKKWSDQFRTELGLRFDHNQGFQNFEDNYTQSIAKFLTGYFVKSKGNFLSPKIAAMYSPNDWLKFRGSVGRGFRAPSWIELYLTFPHPAVGYEAYGNPNLKPETSTGYNFGSEILINRRLLWTVNAFYNDFRDQIEDTTVRVGILSYTNIGRSYTRGFESNWKWYQSRYMTTSAGYQYLEAYNLSAHSYLPHPRHTGNVRLDFHSADDGIGLALRGRVFQRYDQRYDLTYGLYTFELSKLTPKPILDVTLTLNGNSINSRLKGIRFILGGTNLLDYTNEYYGPFTGRRSFISLSYNYAQ